MGVIWTGDIGFPKCEKCGYLLTVFSTCPICRDKETNIKSKKKKKKTAVKWRLFYRLNMNTKKETKVNPLNIKKVMCLGLKTLMERK